MSIYKSRLRARGLKQVAIYPTENPWDPRNDGEYHLGNMAVYWHGHPLEANGKQYSLKEIKNKIMIKYYQ